MGRQGKALGETRRRAARLEERERARVVTEGSKRPSRRSFPPGDQLLVQDEQVAPPSTQNFEQCG